MRVTKQCVPLCVGVAVVGLGLSLGYNTGCAINPARDLAPRLLTLLAGWGPGVFTEYNHWYHNISTYLHLSSIHIYNIYTGGWSPYWPPMLAPWPGPGSTTSRWRPTGRQRPRRPSLWIRCIVGHLMFLYNLQTYLISRRR